MVKSRAVEAWLERFRPFLTRRRYSRFAVKSYLCVARAFLHFLVSRRIRLTEARPPHVDAFLRSRWDAYRRTQGREPADVSGWRSHYTSPVHLLLRMAQGDWPPPTPSSRWISSYRLSLQHRHRRRQTIIAYQVVVQRFLSFLERRGTSLEHVRPTDVDAFLKYELAAYRRRHGHGPKDLVGWRCSLTPPVHDLLRHVQGEWPPPFAHPWFERFRSHMVTACRKPKTRAHYVHAVRLFLAYLQTQGTPLEQVEPTHVEAYVRTKLAEYRSRHHRAPGDPARWSWSWTIPIHRLLRFARGHWPPAAPPEPLLERLRAPLVADGYSHWRQIEMDRVARQFIAFLRDRGLRAEQVQSSVVESFIAARLERYRRRHGHEPPHPGPWRARHVAPVHRLLRLAQDQWPPPVSVASPHARFHRELREDFRHWMVEVRGLSELSFTKDWYTAERLLEWLGERASTEDLRQLSPSDLDAFLAKRMVGLRRTTRCGVCTGLRSFLRYLRTAGLIERDLASCVDSPSRYWNEGIPSAFTDAQVKAMLASARNDRGRAGRRDYAILLILATYGLRAGEITRLNLSDIDWRREQFRVTQSKTKRSSHLPLTSAVGDAILDYLQHGRPPSPHREVFLRANAPHTPFARGSALTTVVLRRMRRAGVVPAGKHGAHAFRFARAVGLLRAAVPLKTISDLLGHSTSASTEIYLKLDTDELREVALELPEEVAP